jgi:ParB/RepB/Spo0J family partition protein
MNPLTLPINDIIQINRQRLDLGDIQGLADSISRYGLIQPIVITKDRRLIAGGRRLEAHRQLGKTTIEVVFREDMSQEELHILELEENIRRKEETWQERCLHIATIHRLKQKVKAIEGDSWTQRATAELLGVDSVREVNHALKMASLLEAELDENKKPKEGARFWACETITEAFRLHFRDEVELTRAELARRQAEATAQLAPSITEFTQEPVDLGEFESIQDGDSRRQLTDEELAKARAEARYYQNPHNPPGTFEEYWTRRQAMLNDRDNLIYISSQLINTDCITFMRENPGRFNHVITDIPYGIDMDMISQSNNTFRDIDQVEELHKVDYNLKLIADFFPAAFNTIKEKGFCITWCDQMLWQYMYDHAVAAGFAVQRWPITWIKNTAMNSCVAYNSTKNTEIAIVCRKKGTTLAKQTPTSVIQCGKDSMCNTMDHPFAKPFECWKFLVEMASLEGESILEPFAGRGSGVLSMLQLNRRVIGTELDTTHYNALLENIKQMYYLPLNPNYRFV